MKPPASGDHAREVAHDLNNLLTAIIGASDAVLDRLGVDSETRADIEHVREGARRGAVLIRRFRDGPNQPVRPDLISINEAILATYRLLDHRLGANLTLALDLTEPSSRVMADPFQLDRMLLNLISNARHAMPQGGTVTLGTTRRVLTTAESLVPDTVDPGDYAVIAVVDTGMGISRDNIARIFESGFSSRKAAGGSGLGLSSVRDIVRQSNGFISVKSAEGVGSRFEIYLPRVVDPAMPEATEAILLPDALTVLLVEDDLLVRHVAERVLRRAGWTVLCADSAEIALEILRDTQCALIISDIALSGMDGRALARLVRARQPDMPFILSSGYEHSARDDAEFADVVFLIKPYGQAELLDAVARISRWGAASN